MWGKLTERNNNTNTKIIREPKELYGFLATPGIVVASLTFASDDVIWASWRFIKEEKIPNLRHMNGHMTSELKPSESIEEFTSGGPKNSAKKVVNTVTGERKQVCKVRGITLNYNASRLVNFDVIRDMILKEGPVMTVHSDHKIKRKRKSEGGIVSIVTEPEDKIYRISFFKRRRLNDETSLPFGYK